MNGNIYAHVFENVCMHGSVMSAVAGTCFPGSAEACASFALDN